MSILDQKISARRILGMVAGVVIIGIGIAVFKFSHLGNDSISALNLRLAELAGLPFSIENVLMNLFLFVPQLINCNRLRIGQREFIIISIDILHVEMANQAAVSSFCSIRKRLSSLNVQAFCLFR